MLGPSQISNVLKEISKNVLVFIGVNLGEGVLSTVDRNLLISMGIQFEKLFPQYPSYYKMYLLGRLTQLIGEHNSSSLSYLDFEEYLKRRQYHPLTQFEEVQYKLARHMTYSHLKNLENRMRGEVEGEIINSLSRSEYEKVIKKEIEEGILERKTVSEVVSNIGHKTNDWAKDIGRIVDTEMNNIFQRGRAVQIINSSKGDPLVYKDVYPGACRHCIRLYLTGGIGSKPRIYKMSQLIENGTNIGKKVDDWKASIESTHPWCFTNSKTPIYTSKGYRFIKDIKVDDLVLTHKGRFRKVTSLVFSKRKIEGVYVITCQLKNKDRKIVLRDITGDHPVLVNGNWIKASQIRVGHKLHLLHDKCDFRECNNDYPIYYKDEVDFSKVDHCSVSCKNYDKSQKRTKEERQKLTLNGRESYTIKYPNNSSPFFSNESKIKANRSNGKKCSYIELKLRYFLDQLKVEYLVDYSIKRNELKKNGQKKLYFPDIYIPSLNIVLEADGINWHEDIEADKKRDREIKELIGADVFRFTEDNIRNNGEGVFEEIQRIVKNHRGEYTFHHIEVIDIKFIKRDSLVERNLYNFSVEEDESYIVNGLPVHNCRCTLREVDEFMIWDEKEEKFVYDDKRLKEEESKLNVKGKIKVTVGTKEFVV